MDYTMIGIAAVAFIVGFAAGYHTATLDEDYYDNDL
jgi:hypothetical protein